MGKHGKPKRWRNAPSPCIGVCDYGQRGRCAGCTMTRDEKRGFRALTEKAEKKAFLRAVCARLVETGAYRSWAVAYRRRCRKRDVPCPLDRLERKMGIGGAA